MKKFYGVGVGPGDPELLTIKAVRAIEDSRYIFVPKSKGFSLAARIAEEYISGKEVIELEFPMGKDNRERYKQAADLVDEKLGDCTGAFLTLGDPMTYSTYVYLLDELRGKDMELETIPGISSFAAAASRLNQPLSVKDEALYICDGELDEEILDRFGTVCILKVNRDKEKTIDTLEKNGFDYKFIKRVTQEDEAILLGREEILEEDDYMSLIIGRRR